MARGSSYRTSRPPKPPRPPNRLTGTLLIAFMIVGALAGVAVGLYDVNGESKSGKAISCGGSAFSIVVSGSDSIVPTGDGARANFAQHICWRDAERNSLFAGALILAPFVVVLVYARRRNRSGEEL
jgi:hypothetical protein